MSVTSRRAAILLATSAIALPTPAVAGAHPGLAVSAAPGDGPTAEPADQLGDIWTPIKNHTRRCGFVAGLTS